MIHLLRSQANPGQLEEMLERWEDFIKVAVDFQLEILAGEGGMHADGEKLLLDEGSFQEDIWGATWWSGTNAVTHESIINLRPRQRNFSMEIADPMIRDRVTEITQRLLEVK
jgi:Protein of unknown function (DUF5674)